MEKIGRSAFQNSGLKKIIIPRSVTVIKENAFYMCENLTHIMFPNDSMLETIENQCFEKSGIEEFLAPPNLKTIGSNTFF